MEPLAFAMRPVSESPGLLVFVASVVDEGWARLGFEDTEASRTGLPSSSTLGANSFRVKTLSLSLAIDVKSAL